MTKIKETWRLNHQFDKVEVEVYDNRVAAINIQSLLSETGEMANILTLGTIKLQVNRKYRKKLMSMKGMNWDEFKKTLLTVGYTAWNKVK